MATSTPIRRPNVRRVAGGERLRVEDHNSLVDILSSQVAENVGSVPQAPSPLGVRWFDISSIDDVAQTLSCVDVGYTGAFRWTVTLPPIYTEASRSISGGLVSYVYSDINTRTASRSGDADETQFLTPPLLVGEVIQATFSNLTQGYVMNPDGRNWAIDPPAP